jgi:hypothetical protein
MEQMELQEHQVLVVLMVLMVQVELLVQVELMVHLEQMELQVLVVQVELQ